jgi:hypothetical protein
MLQQDLPVFIFGVANLTLTIFIWMARSETEVSLPSRRLEALGLLQAVGVIFALYDETADSNKTHWIQNTVSIVSFAILPEFTCRGIADLSDRRSIALPVRVALFYHAICYVFTLNQVGVLSRLLWDRIAFLLCICGEIIRCKTQFLRMILDNENPVNLQIAIGSLSKFNLTKPTSESIASNDDFELQKLTQAIKDVAAKVNFIAPCEVATLLEATYCLENASDANVLRSRLKRQFLLLKSP